jgi:hypothetical protein
MSTVKILDTLLASLQRYDVDAVADEGYAAYAEVFESADGIWVRFDDIETMIKKIKADIQKQEIEQSWRDNPDRMGGQFADNEINGNEWR